MDERHLQFDPLAVASRYSRSWSVIRSSYYMQTGCRNLRSFVLLVLGKLTLTSLITEGGKTGTVRKEEVQTKPYSLEVPKIVPRYWKDGTTCFQRFSLETQ